MPDHRYKVRHRVAVPVTIESGRAQVGGVVLDVSATGARVRLSSRAFLGSRCLITTAIFGEAVPGLVVWRRGVEVGLRFKTTLNVSQEPGVFRARPFNIARSNGVDDGADAF